MDIKSQLVIVKARYNRISKIQINDTTYTMIYSMTHLEC